MNKGDLPLMYSCDFWWEFIDLVVLLAVMVLPLCNSLQVLQGSHNKKRLNRWIRTKKTQEYIKGKSPLFFKDEKVEYNDI